MKKIPTLFKRNPEDLKRVLSEVTPGCEWVIAGEGVPTRKYDGTCVMLDASGAWWARREVKPGKPFPDGFEAEQTDETTGKTVGWVPMEDSAFARWHAEALAAASGDLAAGTYELCGPKINGNPESYAGHVLVLHDGADEFSVSDLTFEALRDTVLELGTRGIEGIVWHHPDGRMAKLKARDFPR